MSKNYTNKYIADTVEEYGVANLLVNITLSLLIFFFVATSCQEIKFLENDFERIEDQLDRIERQLR